MKRQILVFLAFSALILAGCNARDHDAAAGKPYNTTADARLDIKQALARAAVTHTSVIVIFGANWCPDCRELDHAMSHEPCATLIARDFQVVKVSVGHFNRNLAIAADYGVPLAKGIPAVAILSSPNQVLYVTKEGELANARDMGDTGIYDFFKRVTAGAKARN